MFAQDQEIETIEGSRQRLDPDLIMKRRKEGKKGELMEEREDHRSG